MLPVTAAHVKVIAVKNRSRKYIWRAGVTTRAGGKITRTGSLLPDSISGSPDCCARYDRLYIWYARARDSFYEGYGDDSYFFLFFFTLTYRQSHLFNTSFSSFSMTRLRSLNEINLDILCQTEKVKYTLACYKKSANR